MSKPNLTPADKAAAEHIFSRIRIYGNLIEAADQENGFAEVARLTAEQDRLRAELRQIIF